MKIRLSKEQIDNILDDPEKAQETGVKINDPWWLVVLRRDGSVENGRPLEMVGAHCLNHNLHSIGICYEGGLDANGKPADTRTPEQKVTMRNLLERLRKQFPRAIITGHNMFNPTKDCPCFDTGEYADLQPK